MFRCCQTLSSERLTNEIQFETIHFPDETSDLSGVVGRQSRSATGASFISRSPALKRELLPLPARLLTPVGSVAVVPPTPRKRASKESKSKSEILPVVGMSPEILSVSVSIGDQQSYILSDQANASSSHAEADPPNLLVVSPPVSELPSSPALGRQIDMELSSEPILPSTDEKSPHSGSVVSFAEAPIVMKKVSPLSSSQLEVPRADITLRRSPSPAEFAKASHGREVSISSPRNIRGFLRAPPPTARAAGAPGGLRTRDRSKMVDLLDDKAKREMYVATKFVRESIEIDPQTAPSVCQREKAFLVWCLLFAAQLDAANKQHPVATTCAHLMDLAQGEIATNTAIRVAPKVIFLIKAIVRPALEHILAVNAKHDAIWVAKDILDTARVTLGEKPPSLAHRAPYLEELLLKIEYIKLRRYDNATRDRFYKQLLDAMNDDFVETRDNFTSVVDDIIARISS